jgi:hypothetical protein
LHEQHSSFKTKKDEITTDFTKISNQLKAQQENKKNEIKTLSQKLIKNIVKHKVDMKVQLKTEQEK